MGLLDWLFGGTKSPDQRGKRAKSAAPSECWWDRPKSLPLAAGRGFNTDVAGESQWQANLSRVAGGKGEGGHKLEIAAELVFEANKTDRNAVGVMIESKQVGWIPAHDAAQIRSELSAINPDGLRMMCKAKIVGGWDRGDGDDGHFGVKLSLSRPLRRHSSQR